MRLSRYSNFPDLDLFCIFEPCFFTHVFFTWGSKAGFKYAKKYQKSSKILIAG